MRPQLRIPIETELCPRLTLPEAKDCSDVAEMRTGYLKAWLASCDLAFRDRHSPENFEIPNPKPVFLDPIA